MANTVLGTHGSGDHASRPAGNAVPDGSLYSCTTHSLIYVSSYAGNSWATWASLTGTGMADPMTTRGDIIYRDSGNATARLAIGAAGTVPYSNGTDLAYAIPRVAVSENFMSGDVTMTNANQFYDGPTLTPAAGKYMFVGKVVCLNNSALVDTLQAKLWDGTTTIDETFVDIASGLGAGADFFVTVQGTFTTDGVTAVKVSCAGGRAGWVIKQNVRANSATSGKASRLACWPVS